MAESETRHALYVGWVMAQLQQRGFLVRNTGMTRVNRLHLMPVDTADICFEVDVPYPPDEWQ
jgi:hypothetical protein